MKILHLNFFARRRQPPLIETPKTPKMVAAEKRNEHLRALTHVVSDDIITITVAYFHELRQIEALRDLSRTADRAADYLERDR